MKGMFTQGIAILLERAISLDDLEKALGSYEVGQRDTDHKPEEWYFSGPGVVIAYRPEVNGYIAVDIVDRPWPDHMGDPQNEKELFAAWGMGFFGPLTFPGNLERAMEHSNWWPDGPKVAPRHRAFLRVRSSYTFGADLDDTVLPPDYNPLDELLFVTEVVEDLLSVPGALCYFNPNGEALRGPEQVRQMLNHYRNGGPPPLPLWCNIRSFLDEEKTKFFTPKQRIIVVETVGMHQLDAPDHLARCPVDRYTVSGATGFLLNSALYVFQNGPVVQVGETAGGSSQERWKLEAIKEGPVAPPREVYHWRAP